MRWLKKGCRCLLAPFFVLLAYLAAALVLGLIPSRTSVPMPTTAADYPVYLVSNGVHINLVLPLYNDIADWRDRLPESEPGDWVYIGWGSRAFYTQVPTWADLTPQVAAQALFYDDAVLYVRPAAIPIADAKHLRKMRMCQQELQSVSQDIAHQFADTTPVSVFPNFYPAQGHYTPLMTCNEWMRLRLQHRSMPLWSPFDQAILNHLPH